MRKVVALVLSFAVQAAAVGSPLVHLHSDDHDTDHHAAREVHAHWTGHAVPVHDADSPAIDAADHELTIFLNAFAAERASALAAPGLAQAVFAVPVPPERAAHRGVEVIRSHDPPFVTSLTSRAPPPILS